MYFLIKSQSVKTPKIYIIASALLGSRNKISRLKFTAKTSPRNELYLVNMFYVSFELFSKEVAVTAVSWKNGKHSTPGSPSESKLISDSYPLELGITFIIQKLQS